MLLRRCCLALPCLQVPAWKKANQAAAHGAKKKADQSALQAATAPPDAATANATATAGSSDPAAPPLLTPLLPTPLPAAPFAAPLAAPLASAAAVSAVTLVRRDVDRLATQRTAAGLKAEKHAAVDVVLFKPNPRSPTTFAHHQRFVYNPNPMGSGSNGNFNNQHFNTQNHNFNHQNQEPEPALPDAQRRFLSVSNGSIFVASYFTLLDGGGFVECSTVKRGGGSSEKIAELGKCTVEVSS